MTRVNDLNTWAGWEQFGPGLPNSKSYDYHQYHNHINSQFLNTYSLRGREDPRTVLLTSRLTCLPARNLNSYWHTPAPLEDTLPIFWSIHISPRPPICWLLLARMVWWTQCHPYSGLGAGRGCSVGYLDGPGVFRLYYVFIASWMAGDQVPKSPT